MVRVASAWLTRIEIDSQEVNIHRDNTDHARFYTIFFQRVARHHVKYWRHCWNYPFVTFAAIIIRLSEFNGKLVFKLTGRRRAEEIWLHTGLHIVQHTDGFRRADTCRILMLILHRDSLVRDVVDALADVWIGFVPARSVIVFWSRAVVL